MLQTILFPFRLLYYVVLTLFRIIGFFLGFGFRTARFMSGSFLVLGIGILLGMFLGKKFGDGRLPARRKNSRDPAPGRDGLK
jgi:hypothetical protein